MADQNIQAEQKNYALVGFIALVMVVVITMGAGCSPVAKKSDDTAMVAPVMPTPEPIPAPVAEGEPTPSTPEPTPPPTPEPAPTATAALYEDGTYSVVGNYNSPGGPESINVTATLKNDIVTAVEVVSNAVLPNSKKFQGIFIANYKPLVIGKNIDSIQLDKVSGSSLTPKGFNDALADIRTEAKA